MKQHIFKKSLKQADNILYTHGYRFSHKTMICGMEEYSYIKPLCGGITANCSFIIGRDNKVGLIKEF